MSREEIKSSEEGGVRREVNIMYKISELGKYDLIKNVFKSYQFPEIVVYECIKKCLEKYENKNQEFFDTMKELLAHININYKNSADGKNILMLLCELGDYNLIEMFLNQPKFALNVADKDKSGKNIFHHLFTKKYKLESNILKIFNSLIHMKKGQFYNSENYNIVLKEPDNEGKIPINYLLLNGWFNVLSKFLEYVSVTPYLIPIENNNLLHCAVDGNNFNCLKMMLSLANASDFTVKNKDGFTPAVYAAKKQKYFFSKIIEKTESNMNNYEYKKLLLGPLISKREIFNLFLKKEYYQSYTLINIFKVNQYIIRDIQNIPLDWNIFLTKRLMMCSNGIEPEHILSKFLATALGDFAFITNNGGMSCFNTGDINLHKNTLVEDVKNFYQKYEILLNIKDHIDEESFPIDLIIYNKAILYYKLGDYPNLFETIKLYFLHIRPQNDSRIYKFIVYINFIFILIEVFIEKNLFDLASVLIDKTESDLNENYKQIKNLIKNDDESEDLVKYLNENEIFSQFSPTWDEYFCYLQLLKSLLFNKYSKKYLTEYKNVAKNCNYASNLEIFNKLKSIYIMIKAKMNYNNNFILKSLKRIALIKELYFDYSNEHKLFYFNSLGILNLKSRNYSRAELMFKLGLEISKKMNNSLSKNKKDALIPKSNYVCYLQFNLALTFFFQRKFKESNEILSELSKINIMNKNIFLWYRLGLTSLELHFTNKSPKNAPEIFLKTLGYSNTETNTAKEDNANKLNHLTNLKGLNDNDDNLKEDSEGDEEEEEEENSNENEESGRNAENKEDKEEHNLKPSKAQNKCKSQSTSNKKNSRKVSTTSDKPQTNAKSKSISPCPKKEVIAKNTTSKKTEIKEQNNNSNTFDELYNQFEEECKISDDTENNYKANNYFNSKTNKQRLILLHSSAEKNTNSEYLKKAIYCFKKVLLLYNTKLELSSSESTNIEGILNMVLKGNKKPLSSMIDKSDAPKGNIPNMIISSYLNLLFSLSLSNRYTEILFIIQSCFTNSELMANLDFKIRLTLFKIEALLALGRYKEANQIISENLNDNDQNNYRTEMFNKLNGGVISDFNFKLNLYVNNILLLCKKKSFNEAENLLMKVINNFYKGKDIPNFIFNIAIFIFCSQGNLGILKSIKLIKKRTFEFLLNNNTNQNFN